jgi:predicted  nucleic acid-binding Zn-ribbon protein
MKASPEMQQLLLALADLDLNASRQKNELSELMQGASLALLRDQLAATNETYLNLRNAEERLQEEIARVAGDLESVEKRIEHDRVLVNSATSSKNIEGIEHELRSLSARKSDLEDAELELLEQLDVAKVQRMSVETQKATRAQALLTAEGSTEALLVGIRSSMALLVQERAQKLALLPLELAELYERLAARAIGAARLAGRDCDACRISLTASAYDDVISKPADEISTCPNCQTVLVRV